MTDPTDATPITRHDGYPVAEPLRVIHDRSVEVRCPACNKIHTHGWGPDMRHEYSHRVAHCPGGDSYYIGPTGDLA